jgi:hypothetical protein
MTAALVMAICLAILGAGPAWANLVDVSVRLADVEDRIRTVAQKANTVVQEHNDYLPTAYTLIEDYTGCLHYIQIGIIRGDCWIDAAQVHEAEARLDQLKATYLELIQQLETLRAERTRLRFLMNGRKTGALTR